MSICALLSDEPSFRNEKRKRVLRVGRDLDRISRGLNSKIPVILLEGKKRPEAPMQAAKLASEAGITLRNHIPILPHWKLYKKEKAMRQDFREKVAVSRSAQTFDLLYQVNYML